MLAYQSDPGCLRFYPWTARTPQDAQTLLAMLIAWQGAALRTKQELAITVRPRGCAEPSAAVGNVGIKPSPEATAAGLGYELASACWGPGYAAEAATAMLRLAFVDLRVSATCIADNVASARMLAKPRMRLEGRLREHQWLKGRRWDTLLYGLLDHEGRALHPEGPV